MNSKTKTKILLVVFAMIVRLSLSLPLTGSNSPDSDCEEITLPDIKEIPKSSLTIFSTKIRSDEINENDTISSPIPGSLRSKDAVRTYYHRDESWIDNRYVRGDRFRLHFDLTEFPSNEMVYAAKLNLIIVPNPKPENVLSNFYQNILRISVYDLVRPGIKNITKPELQEVDTRFVNVDISSSNKTTLSLDVSTMIINRWLGKPGFNWGLIVYVKSPGRNKPIARIQYKNHAVDKDVDVDSWKPVPSTLSVYSEKVKFSELINLSKIKRKKPIIPPFSVASPEGRTQGEGQITRLRNLLKILDVDRNRSCANECALECGYETSCENLPVLPMPMCPSILETEYF